MKIPNQKFFISVFFIIQNFQGSVREKFAQLLLAMDLQSIILRNYKCRFLHALHLHSSSMIKCGRLQLVLSVVARENEVDLRGFLLINVLVIQTL